MIRFFEKFISKDSEEWGLLFFELYTCNRM